MEWIRLIEWLLLPPGGTLLLILAGLLLPRRAGRPLALTGVLVLYLASTPFIAERLAVSLDRHPAPDDGDLAGAEAIVVLAAGMDHGLYGDADYTVDRFTLERLRIGARLHRRTGLPLAVTGGAPYHAAAPGGEIMRRDLARDFGVSTRWVETRSRNTWENAVFTAEKLHADGIGRIVLVTHAMHMPRSAASFRRQGLRVVPAPVDSVRAEGLEHGIWAWVPRATSLMETQLALHEYVGLLWYRWRYY